MSGRDGAMTVMKFLGWLLMAIGVVIAGTAGACTLVVGVPFFLSTLSYPQGLPESLVLMLVLGGIPLLVGIGVFFGGRWLARRGDIRRRSPRRIDDAGGPH